LRGEEEFNQQTSQRRGSQEGVFWFFLVLMHPVTFTPPCSQKSNSCLTYFEILQPDDNIFKKNDCVICCFCMLHIA
jgi:hypothetical protein